MAILPIELWHSIFEHLEDLADLASCALVSKALYFEVKTYRIRELQFVCRDFRRIQPDGLLYRHQVDSKACLFGGSSFNLEFLKSLRIEELPSAYNLNVINKFVQLEVLDINLAYYPNERSAILKLPSLKVLYLFKRNIKEMCLQTPKLTKLYTTSLLNLEFPYPGSIHCIRTFFHSGMLSKFSNLQNLFFTDHYNQIYPARYRRGFVEFDLKPLKKLKEIEFHYTSLRKSYFSGIKAMAKRVLALGRPELKMFWMNMQVTDVNLLTEYEKTIENGETLAAFQMRHYEKLKDQVERQFLSSRYKFNSSTRCMQKAGFDLRSEEFTLKLLAKNSFGGIEVTGQVHEEEHLMKLIAGSPRLWCLEFENSGLDQSFFDRMADTVRLNGIPLWHLQFKKTSSELNFDFVLKLDNLRSFITDQPMKGLVPKLLQLPLLEYIKFDSSKFVIKRPSSDTLLLNEVPISLEDLIEKVDSDSPKSNF